MDRGRYAGPVGWMDADGDGEWGIALRSAEYDGNRVRLFAGCGIVADSDPEAELAEAAAKFVPVRDALGGRAAHGRARHPAHRVAPAEVGPLPRSISACDDEGPVVRREGQHVRDHPAVGEHLGGLAQRIDEGVVEPARRRSTSRTCCEERRPDLGQPLPHRRRPARPCSTRPVVLAHRRSRTSTCPSARPGATGSIASSSSRPRCRPTPGSSSSSWSSSSVGGAVDQLADEPDVVLDHLLQQVHRGHLFSGGHPQAAGWVEMHAARSVEEHRAGVRAETATAATP